MKIFKVNCLRKRYQFYSNSLKFRVFEQGFESLYSNFYLENDGQSLSISDFSFYIEGRFRKRNSLIQKLGLY